MKTPRYSDKKRYPHGYRSAPQSDIRKTFARVKAERKAAAELAAHQAEAMRMEDERNAQEAAVKMVPIKRTAK